MKSKFVLAILLFSSISFGITLSEQEFFYKAGYQKGYKEGYEKGYKDAMKKFLHYWKEIVNAYYDDIKAKEIGKYLVENGYITPPSVWRIKKDDGSVEIKISGCKIEKIRNIEDIIKNPWDIPELDCKRVQEVKKASEEFIKLIETPNMVSPQGYSYKLAQVVIVKVTPNAKNLLNQLGIPYEISPKSGEIKAIFFDYKQAQNFCKTYKVCE